MFVLICYDVPAERTEVYRKMLREYLVHEQNSVFMGDLPEAQIIRMMARISHNIQPEDKVLKLVCRNRHNVQVVRLGKDAQGGQMSQQPDLWHGKNWSLI